MGCTKCNSPPSTASVPVTELLYGGPLLRGFNAAIKGFKINIREILGRGS